MYSVELMHWQSLQSDVTVLISSIAKLKKKQQKKPVLKIIRLDWVIFFLSYDLACFQYNIAITMSLNYTYI